MSRVSPAEKALDWARQQAIASRDVRDLTHRISLAPVCGKRTKSHYPTCLEAAYEGHTDTDENGPRTEYLTTDEAAEFVADCPECSRLHDLIQQRKAARKRLGTARRSLTLIGRMSLTMEGS